MSVPLGQRTESKLEVQTRARELALYTVQICGNEKHFPKRDRWIVTNRIVGTALTIMEEVDIANDIYVSTRGDFELRRQAQTIAFSNTAKLLGLLELAQAKYDIGDRRVQFWADKVLEVRALIKKWRQSDKNRYDKKNII
jgi:hypothetical protein